MGSTDLLISLQILHFEFLILRGVYYIHQIIRRLHHQIMLQLHAFLYVGIKYLQQEQKNQHKVHRYNLTHRKELKIDHHLLMKKLYDPFCISSQQFAHSGFHQIMVRLYSQLKKYLAYRYILMQVP